MALEDHKPVMLMILMQCSVGGLYLVGRAALLDGMSTRVFVVYRQCFAFLIMAPIAYFNRRQEISEYMLGWKSFWLVFFSTFIGITVLQNLNMEGLHLSATSVTAAFINFVPAITFLISYIIGLEKVDLCSWKSSIKIIGTIVCMSGGVVIALFKGPKLLKSQHIVVTTFTSFSQGGSSSWLLGCLLSVGSAFCWSFWLILQVPLTKNCPNSLLLAAWIAIIGVFQSAIVALVMEPSFQVWRLNSLLEVSCCIYGGMVSGFSFFAQAWCISRRGPLFSAMFNPLVIVIDTIFGFILLGEHLYIGSLAGSGLVILGLYCVLWGKAKDLQDMKVESGANSVATNDDSPECTNIRADMEQPLLQ